MIPLFDQVREKAEQAATRLEDRLLRYVSSPQEHDLLWVEGYTWPMLYRAFMGRFPWEEPS